MTVHEADTGLDKYAFGKGERIRHALDWARVSIGDIADELEVHRNTVGAWINDRNNPRRRDLRIIAVRTGFSLEWLEEGKLPDLDSNQEPAGIKPSPAGLVVYLDDHRRGFAHGEPA